MREYAFELAMCAAVEADSDGLVARQLGSHTRIVDVVEVRRGPEFSARADITAEAIPDLAIESDVGVGRARYWKEAFDAPADRAESAVDRAVDIGFFAAERRNCRRYVRQTARYPDWFGSLRAFENKPDLGRPGDLQLQLRKDVSLGLFDEVVLVTESYVTGAHLNRIPEAVGVWRFFPEEGRFEVVREATPLSTDDPGIAVLDESPARVDVEPVTADEKARYRRRIAERAYGKGWRPDALPACERAEASGPAFHPDDALPYCAWKGRFVDPARECGADCGGYDPADPPEADVEAARARHSSWDPDPDGRDRRQVGLDRFAEE
ncbi:DUF5787 family protein [Natronomonas sp.]|uniref:DUF5787 family protein n=1 Tax=Natronomonas sp. TaxID=2184060 RepID=UPI002FC2A961